MDSCHQDDAHQIPEEMSQILACSHLRKRAEMLFERGQFEEARLAFHKVRDRCPSDIVAVTALAVIYGKEGRLRDAHEIARAILEKNLVDESIALFKKTFRFYPGESNSHLRLGRFYRQLGLFDEALQQFSLANSSQEALLKSRNEIAMCLADMNKIGEAVTHLIETLELSGFEDEDFVETIYNLLSLDSHPIGPGEPESDKG